MIGWICSKCLRTARPPLRASFSHGFRAGQQYSTSFNSTHDDLERTRNIGIIAHIDAGKTTTTERMLYYSGFTRRIGEVDEGSTVTDFLPAERARGITIQSAAITFHWPPRPPEGQKELTLQDTIDKNFPRSAISHTINLIDTPGHADFTFEVLRSLRILDGAVCILDGVAGVEAQTEKVWHQASIYNIPRIVYVNKLDRDGAAFGKTVKEVALKLGVNPAVCQIPWYDGKYGRFQGVGDIIQLRGLFWPPDGDGKKVKSYELDALAEMDERFAEQMQHARTALIELLSEYDDDMVESFLASNEKHTKVEPVAILRSLRRCLLNPGVNLTPVFAGASFRNIGVQPLLDAVINLLPTPMERPDPEVTVGSVKGKLQDLLSGELVVQTEPQDVSSKKQQRKKTNVTRHADTQKAIQKLEGCALAFKVVTDAKRGVLVYVRVYSGSVERNSSLFNTNLATSERAPRLLRMYASDAVEIQSIPAGHIGVIVGLKYARTGDTLVSYPGNKATPPAPLNKLQLRPIEVPPPVFFASIEAHSLSEEKSVLEALALLLREDPSLNVTMDEDSGQTLLSGMGELHLEIARDRLVNELKAKASMGQIEIGYRECASSTSLLVTKVFERDIAGRKGKAGCSANVAPFDPSATDGSIFSSSTPGKDVVLEEIRDGNLLTIVAPGLYDEGRGRFSDDLLPPHLDLSVIRTAILNGCLSALARGPKHSFPVHNTHVTLTFDLAHDLYGAESTSSALAAAARLATQSALKEVAASSALMEPVMNVNISVPEASLGTVVHDISSARGGHIVSLDDENDVSAPSSTDRSVAVDLSRIYLPPDPYGSLSSVTDGVVVSGAKQSRQINARIPLKEMVGYLKHLRSMTGGRGTFVMSVDRFEKMSAQREKLAIEQMKGML